ncbi:hypothetical protein [Aminobacter niigataensis]|uniref:hypothetical protein n=1 Tax=Aminobacter niigataensis TaxID=83265 RepID=UPI0024C58A9A|nr:hypothetical protein [Aminobacter niigataensis]CAI2932473.1 conserved exported protein of unknown function [Aminobacter niigataensis]
MSAQAMSITRRLFLRNTAAASAAVATVAAPAVVEAATTPPVSGMDRIKLALDELRAAMDDHVSPQEGPWDVVLNCDRRRKVTAILVGGKVFFESVDAGDASRGGAI